MQFVYGINQCLLPLQSYVTTFRTKNDYIQIHINNINVVLDCVLSVDGILLIQIKKLDINSFSRFGSQYIMQTINKVVECISNHLPPNQDIYISLIDRLIYTYNNIDGTKINICISHLELLAEGKGWYTKYGFVPTGDDGYPSKIKYTEMLKDIREYSAIGRFEAIVIFQNIKFILGKSKLSSKEIEHVKQAQQFLKKHAFFLYSTYSRFLTKWVRKNKIGKVLNAVLPAINDFIPNINRYLSGLQTEAVFSGQNILEIDVMQCAKIEIQNWNINEIVIFKIHFFFELCRGKYSDIDDVIKNILEIIQCIYSHLPFCQNACIHVNGEMNIYFTRNQTSISISFLELLASGTHPYIDYGFIAINMNYPDQGREDDILNIIKQYQEENTGIQENATRIYNNISNIPNPNSILGTEEETKYIVEADTFIKVHKKNLAGIFYSLETLAKWVEE
jgi:hypothetical protein